VDSFGNIKPEPYSGKPEVNPLREPLIEVNEEEDQIIVVAEMPGVSKEDVEIKATSRTLTISTKPDSLAKKYHKEVELPAAINSDYAKARIQNGILEVKLKKINERHKDIKVD
jgi:HSP20 family protein